MGYKEKSLIDDYLSSLPENVRMFRTNSGMAWAGKSTLKGEFRIIKNSRPFWGLPEGWPDLTGFTEIEIADKCCGSCEFYNCDNNRDVKDLCPDYKPRSAHSVAVFTTVEVKATGKIKPESKQGKFRDLILRMGGLHRELR